MESKKVPLMKSTGDDVMIPDIGHDGFLQYCSLDGRCHPLQTYLEEQTRQWATGLFKAHGLPHAQLQNVLDMKYARLSCLMYPNGTSQARCFTLVKLLHWIFLMDDLFDDHGLHVLGLNLASARAFCSRQLMSMFGPSAVAAAGLGDVLMHDFLTNESKGTSKDQLCQQELVIEIGAEWSADMQAQGISPKQYKRVQEAVVEYLTGVLLVVALREQNNFPSLQQYIPLRRKDGAARICLVGCEFDLNMELDDEALAQPLLEDLYEVMADQVLWINDVLSFNAEYSKGDYINLITVLHYHDDRIVSYPTHKIMDFHKALSQAHGMIKERDNDRTQLSNDIIAWNPSLKCYVEATHYTLFAITAWTLDSLRYRAKCSRDLTD